MIPDFTSVPLGPPPSGGDDTWAARFEVETGKAPDGLWVPDTGVAPYRGRG